jgi:predicted nucleic acid-binding protein
MDAFRCRHASCAAAPARALVGTGSVLLVPEILTRPSREGRDEEIDALLFFLARLDLRPVDTATAEVAVTVGARYGLRAVDAVHLATALLVGADRFITNNRRDFDQARVTELDITYPDDLALPG